MKGGLGMTVIYLVMKGGLGVTFQEKDSDLAGVDCPQVGQFSGDIQNN